MHLVARQEGHSELATCNHEWIGVVLGGDARHDDGLLKRDLGHPMRGIGTSDAIVGGRYYFDCFGSLAKCSLEFRINHEFTR